MQGDMDEEMGSLNFETSEQPLVRRATTLVRMSKEYHPHEIHKDPKGSMLKEKLGAKCDPKVY